MLVEREDGQLVFHPLPTLTWLGHDELEDTVHFEFLGDPDQVME